MLAAIKRTAYIRCRDRQHNTTQDEAIFLTDTWDAEAVPDAAQRPSAAAALAHDPLLRQLRFRLVPKYLTEDRFWQRYFAAVARIKRDVVQGGAHGDGCVIITNATHHRHCPRKTSTSMHGSEWPQHVPNLVFICRLV